MLLENYSAFNIINASVSSLSQAGEKNGFLFLFKVTGEIEIDFGVEKRCVAAKKTACFPLDKLKSVSDNGTTAYFTVSGTLCDEIMRFYSLGGAFEEFSSDTEADFFSICLSGEEKDQGEKALAFHKICKTLSSQRTQIIPKKTDVAPEIKAFLDSSIYKKITIDELKELFFISRSQIFRAFKARYGISPVQYLIERKVETAKSLIQTENMRISDIAEKLCFSDAKHFSKAFKSVTGELPRDFKRRLKWEPK